MLIPIIKPGMRVMIRPGTRYYNRGPGNPGGTKGKIVQGDSSWIRVRWDSGYTNTYEEYDLDFESIPEMFETNINRIYFKENGIKISSMKQLLDILYPENKPTAATYYFVTATGEKFLHCTEGKMRSFDDIWILADTYMPGIEVKEVFRELLLHGVTEKHVKDEIFKKSLSHCSTMRRIRFTTDAARPHMMMASADCNKYDSIYSWRNLFNMLNIKDSADLLKFYKQSIKVEV